MEAWGTDLPIDTIMKDPNTLKLYSWDGNTWIHISKISEEQNTDFEIQMFNYNQWNIHELQDLKENKVKRGRPKTKTHKNTRQPSEYNLYVKKCILEGAYVHLIGKERLALIAKDWTNKNCGLVQ